MVHKHTKIKLIGRLPNGKYVYRISNVKKWTDISVDGSIEGIIEEKR